MYIYIYIYIYTPERPPWQRHIIWVSKWQVYFWFLYALGYVCQVVICRAHLRTDPLRSQTLLYPRPIWARTHFRPQNLVYSRIDFVNLWTKSSICHSLINWILTVCPDMCHSAGNTAILSSSMWRTPANCCGGGWRPPPLGGVGKVTNMSTTWANTCEIYPCLRVLPILQYSLHVASGDIHSAESAALPFSRCEFSLSGSHTSELWAGRVVR